MKFINKSNKIIPMKIDKIWVNVQPEEVVDLWEAVGNSQEGLEKKKSKEDKKPKESKESKESKEDKKPKEIKKKLSLEELKKLSKDGLNDYAAKMGFDAIKSSMKKADMIKKIIKFQKG